jgi:hypothetical protein
MAKEKCKISTIAITHINPDIVETLAAVLGVLQIPADGLTLLMTNPAKQVCSSFRA